jgi:hypothetical protein
MMSYRFRSLITIMLFAIMFSLSGCMALGKVSGGGWLEGAEGGKANLGFNAAQCEVGFIGGSFTYHDKKADKLQIHGDVTNAGLCHGNPSDYDKDLGKCNSCRAIWGGSTLLGCTAYQVEFDYVTQGKAKDTGTGFACVVDCGEGSKALADALYIELDYGYINSGPLSGGNIKAQSCTCTDGLNNDEDEFSDDLDVDCQDEAGIYNPNGDEDIYQPFEVL